MTILEFTIQRLDRAEEKIDAIEAEQVELSATVREATAAVKTGIWIVGILWALSIAGFGIWNALRGGH